MTDQSIKLSQAASDKIENLRIKVWQQFKKKVYKREIIDRAILQFTSCKSCQKSFFAWVSKK